MKKRLLSLVSVAILLLTNCSASTNRNKDITSTGIKIIDAVTSIAASETQQVVSYHFVLYNGESVNIVVHWIEPILIEQVSERLRTSDTRVVVEKVIAPNSSVQIAGEFAFENKGATKAEIVSWEPLITGCTLSSEMTLPLPGQEVK